MKIWISAFAVMVLSACGSSSGDDGGSGNGNGSNNKPAACSQDIKDDILAMRALYQQSGNRVTPEIRARGEAFRDKHGDFKCTMVEKNGQSYTFESAIAYQELGLLPKP